jgi:hypothetical protein
MMFPAAPVIPVKPCPFCGKKPSIERGGPRNLIWHVQCEGDEPEHTVLMKSGWTRKEAILAWNNRFPPPNQP